LPFADLSGAAGGQIRGVIWIRRKGEVASLDPHVQALDVLIDSGLLDCAGGFASELRSVKISVRGKSPGTIDYIPQRLPRLHRIRASVGELPFECHYLCLLRNRDPYVGFGENRDDVSGLQFQVLSFVVSQDQLAQVKGNQDGFQIIGIESLDDGVVPIDLWRRLGDGCLLKVTCKREKKLRLLLGGERRTGSTLLCG
jgi:hypothetical protein